jgi:hypothetical protein
MWPPSAAVTSIMVAGTMTETWASRIKPNPLGRFDRGCWSSVVL